MICKNCGHENAEDLTFCQNCGKRLDGKKICSVCGAKIDEDAKFCGICGANWESTSSETASAQAAAEPAPTEQSNTLDKEKVKKLVDLAGLACVLLAAFFSVVFTFLIGVTASGGGQSKTTLIYSFFGEQYQAVKDTYSTEGLSVIQNALIYLPLALGTAVAALSILCTVVFASLTGLEVYKKFAKNQEKTKLAKYATATYISYAAFATLFFAVNVAGTKVTYEGIGISSHFNFSGATLAGLILGGIALGGYYCCKIANNLEVYKNKKNLISSAVALVVAVLAIVTAALVASPVVSLKYSEGSEAMQFWGGYSFASGYCCGYSISGGVEDLQSIKIIICCSLGTLSQAALIFASVIALVKLAGAVCGDRAKGVLCCTCVSLVVAAVNLVCAIITATTVQEFTSRELTVGYGASIALVVFSALVFIGSIACKILSSKQE